MRGVLSWLLPFSKEAVPSPSPPEPDISSVLDYSGPLLFQKERKGRVGQGSVNSALFLARISQPMGFCTGNFWGTDNLFDTKMRASWLFVEARLFVDRGQTGLNKNERSIPSTPPGYFQGLQHTPSGTLFPCPGARRLVAPIDEGFTCHELSHKKTVGELAYSRVLPGYFEVDHIQSCGCCRQSGPAHHLQPSAQHAAHSQTQATSAAVMPDPAFLIGGICKGRRVPAVTIFGWDDVLCPTTHAKQQQDKAQGRRRDVRTSRLERKEVRVRIARG